MTHCRALFRYRILVVVATCSLFLSLRAHAVTTNWNNNSGGLFTASANWTSGVPDSDDTAVFNRGAGIAYNVTFPGGGIFDPPPSYVIDSLRVHSNNVTFRDNSSPFITRPSLTIGNTADSIIIGQNAGEVAVLTTSLNSLSAGLGANTFIGRFAGADGTLNVAAGTFSLPGFGDLALGDSGTGRLNITGGSVINFNGYIGRSAGSAGTATVSGAGSTWTNSGEFYVGREGAGTLRVEAGGSVVSNTRGIIGSLIGSSGTATVTGAGSTWTNNNDLDVGSFGVGTLRVEAGGRVSNTGGNVGSAVGSTGAATVTGEGSTWFNSNNLSVGASGTGTLIVENGGDVSNLDGYIGHLGGSNGMVTVSGVGSSWTNASELYVGHSGTGTLTIQDGGAVSSTFGRIGIQTSSNGTVTVGGIGSAWTITELLTVGAGGTATLTIEDGGRVSSGPGFVGSEVFGSSTDTVMATATVTGVGSTWTSSSNLEVGYSGRPGTLTIEDGGSVSNINSYIAPSPQGPPDEMATTSVTVTGGGATWNTSGSMYVGGQESIAGAVGSLTVETGGIVNVGQDLVLWDEGTVNLHGGHINVASGGVIFSGRSGGAFNFSFGTLHFTTSQTIGAAGPIVQALGGERRLHLGQHLEIDGALTLSAPFQIDGGHLEADSLAVNSDFVFTAGVLEVRNGSITGVTSLVVPASGELRTRGTHSFRIFGLAGSTITATGNLTLGDAMKVNGFYSSGTLGVGANVVTLRDANDAVFDSAALITLGAGSNPGTLSAANGATLDFGGNITGFGTVNTPNNPVRPLINNGHIRGNSAAQGVTLSGYVKGVGTLDNVVITGTDAPGFSAATVYRGSVTYDGVLEIEIGGTSLGSFDRIIHSGTAALGGKLQVALINGFSPAADNSLDILDWGTITGTFDALQLPSLSGGLAWDTSQLYTTGVLAVIGSGALPGDYNQNGAVDAADFVLWRKNLGSGMSLPNDDTPGVGPDDYGRWRVNFGHTAAASAAASVSTSVAEPACAALMCFAMAGLWMMVRSR